MDRTCSCPVLRPPERTPGSLSRSERLPGPGRDQVALDLGSHREGHGDDPALDGFVEPPGPLDRMDPNAGIRGNGQDLHAFEHRAAEPGKLADDQGIACAQFVQDVCDLSLAPGDPARCRLLDESTRPRPSLLARVRMSARFLSRSRVSLETRRYPMVLDALSAITCPHSKKTVFCQIKDIVRGGLFNDIHRISRAGKTNVFFEVPDI